MSVIDANGQFFRTADISSTTSLGQVGRMAEVENAAAREGGDDCLT
ncbi:MAG: hypothetical protein ABF689_11995 [Gluconobacter cerinus]